MDGEATASGNQELVTHVAIEGAATQNTTQDKGKRREDASKALPETCAICLDPITERAVVVPCNHLSFDFLCLVSWLQLQPSCPLCKAAIAEVQYDWRSVEDYKVYHVSPMPQVQDARRTGTRGPRAEVQRIARGGRTLTHSDPSLERRKQVYRHRLYSLHVGANRISQYKDFTATDFTASPSMQSEARAFLRRELLLFSFLDDHHVEGAISAAPRRRGRRGMNTKDWLIEYIIAILRANELKGSDGRAEDLLAEWLGRDNARLLLHELEAWLRSPFGRLEEWDEQVQYEDAGPSKHVNL